MKSYCKLDEPHYKYIHGILAGRATAKISVWLPQKHTRRCNGVIRYDSFYTYPMPNDVHFILPWTLKILEYKNT